MHHCPERAESISPALTRSGYAGTWITKIESTLKGLRQIELDERHLSSAIIGNTSCG